MGLPLASLKLLVNVELTKPEASVTTADTETVPLANWPNSVLLNSTPTLPPVSETVLMTVLGVVPLSVKVTTAVPSFEPAMFSSTPAPVTRALAVVIVGASTAVTSTLPAKSCAKVGCAQRLREASIAVLVLALMAISSTLEVVALSAFKKATKLMASVLFRSLQLTLPLGSWDPAGASLAKMAKVTFIELRNSVGALVNTDLPVTSKSASKIVVICPSCKDTLALVRSAVRWSLGLKSAGLTPETLSMLDAYRLFNVGANLTTPSYFVTAAVPSPVVTPSSFDVI